MLDTPREQEAVEQTEQAPLTLEALLAMGPDARVEVIEGELAEMSPVGMLHHLIAGNIYDLLKVFITANSLGYVFFDGLLYLMHSEAASLKDSFVPDVSFIRKANLITGWDITRPYPGAPDLAVEVISPGDDAGKVQAKLRAYLDKGTAEVWIVYPNTREVYQYRRDASPAVRLYRRGDEALDTEALFPGLALTLDAIFALPEWAS